MKKDTHYYAKIAKRAIEKISLLESSPSGNNSTKSKYKITINGETEGFVVAINARKAILGFLADPDNNDVASKIGSFGTIKNEDRIIGRGNWAEVACKNGTARADISRNSADADDNYTATRNSRTGEETRSFKSRNGTIRWRG